MDHHRHQNSQLLPTTNLKIAVFYDWLNQWGGAERVLLNILSIYPKADIFTLVHDPNKTKWLPTTHKITSSLINKLPFSLSNPIYYTPFYDIALEQFDFSKYDIVISTTSTIGHCLLTPPSTLFVTYFHNINRHLYNSPFNFYKKVDHIYSRRPDAIICNSQTVFRRLKNIYQLDAKIINPSINTNFFVPSSSPISEYFLVVGRLVKHKRFDIVINSFNQNQLPLVVVGSGRELSNLKKIAKSNIKFVEFISDKELLKYYQNCIALICPQLEDFGLTAIEAQACGKPVIAFGQGGNAETIINRKTGIFFKYQTETSLQKAILKHNKSKFDSNLIRQHSLEFSQDIFMLNFKQTIDKLWKKHLTTTF